MKTFCGQWTVCLLSPTQMISRPARQRFKLQSKKKKHRENDVDALDAFSDIHVSTSLLTLFF